MPQRLSREATLEREAINRQAWLAPEDPTREAWLQKLTDKLREHFREAGYPLKAKTHISVGFPSTRATARSKRRVGECWSHMQSADGFGQIFISPLVETGIEAAAILVHELVHDAIGCEHGHKIPFKRAMLAVGLAGKPTATHASEPLAAYLQTLIDAIGPYPHSVLSYTGKEKKQSTRLIKAECPACGYPARVTRKWLESTGAPICPCSNVRMTTGEAEDSDEGEGE